MIGRTYLERGRPVVVLIRWGPGGGPRNVLVRRLDRDLRPVEEVVRPFRGLRRRGRVEVDALGRWPRLLAAHGPICACRACQDLRVSVGAQRWMRCPECWRFNPCRDHPGAAEALDAELEADRLVEASWDG